MPYKLAEYHGDTLAVPQLVVSHLTQTDGDTIRAALSNVPCNTGPVPVCWSTTAAAHPSRSRRSPRRSTWPA